MVKIESVFLRIFRNNEHLQFMSDVDKLILTHQTSELGIQSLYLDFKNAFDQESKVTGYVQSSSKSQIISDLDSQRDNTWNAINTKVKAALLSPVSEEAESARVLKLIIDQHGDVRSKSYSEESSAIKNLLRDLQEKSNEEHLQKTGIGTWVSALKTQNENFINIIDERNDEYSERPNSNARKVREEIDPIYQQIVEKINAAIVLELAKPAVESFVVKLNEKIAYYKATIAARQARSKDKEKDKTTETSTEKA